MKVMMYKLYIITGVNSQMDFSKELSKILLYEDEAMRLFKKKTYEGAYQNYQTHASDLINKFDLLDEDGKNILLSDFIKVFQLDLDQYKGFKFLQKSEARQKHNMYMVSYVLPFFMEHSESSKEFANKLAKEWGRTFKNSQIIAATYDEIKSGFVTRLFGAIIQN